MTDINIDDEKLVIINNYPKLIKYFYNIDDFSIRYISYIRNLIYFNYDCIINLNQYLNISNISKLIIYEKDFSEKYIFDEYIENYYNNDFINFLNEYFNDKIDNFRALILEYILNNAIEKQLYIFENNKNIFNYLLNIEIISGNIKMRYYKKHAKYSIFKDIISFITDKNNEDFITECFKNSLSNYYNLFLSYNIFNQYQLKRKTYHKVFDDFINEYKNNIDTNSNTEMIIYLFDNYIIELEKDINNCKQYNSEIINTNNFDNKFIKELLSYLVKGFYKLINDFNLLLQDFKTIISEIKKE